MKFCSECGQELTTGKEKFCPTCGLDLIKTRPKEAEMNNNKNTIKINGTKGDVIGVGVSGSGNVIGKNIVVGSGTINVSQTQLQQIPNEYATALESHFYSLNSRHK